MGEVIDAAAVVVLVVGLGVLSWIDVRTQRLPRLWIYVTAAVGVPLLCLAALVEHRPRRMVTMVLGALLALGLLAVCYVAARGGLGDGDVRLAPLLGAYLGWYNPALVIVALLLGIGGGALFGIGLILVRRANRHTTFPFGPFLAAGTLAALVVGERLLDLVVNR